MGAVGAVKPSAVKRGDLRNLWTLLVDSVRLVAGKISLSIFSTPALFSFYHTLSAAQPRSRSPAGAVPLNSARGLSHSLYRPLLF